MRLLLAVLMLFAGTMPAAAQWLDRPGPDIPRTADGKPDLTAPAPRGPDRSAQEGKPDSNRDRGWRTGRPPGRADAGIDDAGTILR